jgi:hypothetical protein
VYVCMCVYCGERRPAHRTRSAALPVEPPDGVDATADRRAPGTKGGYTEGESCIRRVRDSPTKLGATTPTGERCFREHCVGLCSFCSFVSKKPVAQTVSGRNLWCY